MGEGDEVSVKPDALEEDPEVGIHFGDDHTNDVSYETAPGQGFC